MCDVLGCYLSLPQLLRKKRSTLTSIWNAGKTARKAIVNFANPAYAHILRSGVTGRSDDDKLQLVLAEVSARLMKEKETNTKTRKRPSIPAGREANDEEDAHRGGDDRVVDIEVDDDEGGDGGNDGDDDDDDDEGHAASAPEQLQANVGAAQEFATRQYGHSQWTQCNRRIQLVYTRDCVPQIPPPTQGIS